MYLILYPIQWEALSLISWPPRDRINLESNIEGTLWRRLHLLKHLIKNSLWYEGTGKLNQLYKEKKIEVKQNHSVAALHGTVILDNSFEKFLNANLKCNRFVSPQ